MDHTAAAQHFQGLANDLDAAGRHLVGPGFDFVRMRLTDAARRADALADVHTAAAAADTYIRDLLPDPAGDPVAAACWRAGAEWGRRNQAPTTTGG